MIAYTPFSRVCVVTSSGVADRVVGWEPLGHHQHHRVIVGGLNTGHTNAH